ncbi:MAG: SDR family NAD(P)-dependent oxidoreductase, partial [Chloroflexaceae bacterium]|nr:SDR family NAD(P)-dependent oxidoreductase [Chloroflexaceae bacterium]
MHAFHDHVAVITGAASGIGCALAEGLARRGCHLALIDVDGEGLHGLAAQLQTQRRVSAHVVDVAHCDQMDSLPDAVMQQHGRVDIQVNGDDPLQVVAGVALKWPRQRHARIGN